MVEELTRLMCSCLHPLMPSAISCMTEGCDLSGRKSPDTCRGKLYFDNSIKSENESECTVMVMDQCARNYNLHFGYIDCERQQYHLKLITVYFSINTRLFYSLKAVTLTAHKHTVFASLFKTYCTEREIPCCVLKKKSLRLLHLSS